MGAEKLHKDELMSREEVQNRITAEELDMIIDMYSFCKIINIELAHKYYFPINFKDRTSKVSRNSVQRRLKKLVRRRVLKERFTSSGEAIYNLTDLGVKIAVDALGLEYNVYQDGRLIQKNHYIPSDLETDVRLAEHDLTFIELYMKIKRDADLRYEIEEGNLKLMSEKEYYNYFTEQNKSTDTIIKRPDAVLIAKNNMMFVEADMNTERNKSLYNFLDRISKQFDYIQQVNSSIMPVVVFLLNNNQSNSKKIYERAVEENNTKQIDTYKNGAERYYAQISNRRFVIMRNALAVFYTKFLQGFSFYIDEHVRMKDRLTNRILPSMLEPKPLELAPYIASIRNFVLSRREKGKKAELYKNFYKYQNKYSIPSTFIIDTIRSDNTPTVIFIEDCSDENLASIARLRNQIESRIYLENIFVLHLAIVNSPEQAKEIHKLINLIGTEQVNTDNLFFTTIDHLRENSFENAFLTESFISYNPIL